MIIFEKTRDGERNIELRSRLFEDRKIMLTGRIEPYLSEEIVCQLWLLDSKSNDRIKLLINSPGGSVSDGLQIYDVIMSLNSAVDTYCLGQCSSMAAVLLSSGTGYRYAYPNSTIMIHIVSSEIPFSKEIDMEISMEHTKNLNDRLMNILAKNCNKSVSQVLEDASRDNFMTANEAKSYGLIDRIIEPYT